MNSTKGFEMSMRRALVAMLAASCLILTGCSVKKDIVGPLLGSGSGTPPAAPGSVATGALVGPVFDGLPGATQSVSLTAAQRTAALATVEPEIKTRQTAILGQEETLSSLLASAQVLREKPVKTAQELTRLAELQVEISTIRTQVDALKREQFELERRKALIEAATIVP